MIKTCSWCGKVGKENWLEPVGVETHGICQDCLGVVLAESNDVVDGLITENIILITLGSFLAP